MLASKTGKTFGCVQCFVSFLKLKFMPLRGQFIYTMYIECVVATLYIHNDFRDRHI